MPAWASARQRRRAWKFAVLDKKIFKYPGIIITGYLKKTDEIYQLADVFLLPSITEGMPTALMESIMNNIPTVSYSIPGVNDIIKHGLNGIKLNIKDITVQLTSFKLKALRKTDFLNNSYHSCFSMDSQGHFCSSPESL